MSQPPFPPAFANPTDALLGRRRGQPCEPLLLTELNPHSVVDHAAAHNTVIELQSFGTVREPCPKCHTNRLNLILRQDTVRTAHLFCADCRSCYDAHYAGGAPALTI
ncbi:hypothetical protein [Massilia sp. PWRC2]|uniref:hypothetical protein n=1 Tax=Massilia sp. PWRC2 TaxID=2804626 RepID=UPI003CF6D5C2